MRTLNRPMFRMGGNTDQGIMSGVAPRQGYDNGGVTRRKEMLMKGMGQQPDRSLSQFMIDFGLDIASRPPQGSIFSTAAASAKEPFQGYKASKAARAGFEQKIGLAGAESAMAHEDRMKELALKGRTTGLIDDEKEARILWANRRTDTNPSGSFNEETGDDWKSYQEVLNWIVTKSQYSRTGQYSPDVQKDIAVNEKKEFLMEDDIVDNPVDAEAVAEIGWLVQNDEKYAEIKNKFDFSQYIIEAEDFGDKVPGAETGGSTQYKATLDTGRSPDYQHGKIYVNMQDNQFYMFSSAGPGFILVTMTEE